MNRVLLASGLLARGAMASWGTAVADTEDGSCLEEWELLNHQPASSTYQDYVNSSSYHDRTTVFLFLSAG